MIKGRVETRLGVVDIEDDHRLGVHVYGAPFVEVFTGLDTMVEIEPLYAVRSVESVRVQYDYDTGEWVISRSRKIVNADEWDEMARFAGDPWDPSEAP